MRTPIRFLRLSIAAVVAALGLSILGIGAALAAPGKPAGKPVKLTITHERSSRDSAGDRHVRSDRTSRERHAEAVRDR